MVSAIITLRFHELHILFSLGRGNKKICWSYFDRLQGPLVIMLSMSNIARGGFIECLFT